MIIFISVVMGLVFISLKKVDISLCLFTLTSTHPVLNHTHLIHLSPVLIHRPSSLSSLLCVSFIFPITLSWRTLTVDELENIFSAFIIEQLVVDRRLLVNRQNLKK